MSVFHNALLKETIQEALFKKEVSMDSGTSLTSVHAKVAFRFNCLY